MTTTATNPATFEQALAMQADLEAQHKSACDAMGKYPNDGPMGLTPDCVKSSPEWKRDYHAYWEAHNRLRAFNGWFTKAFKRELREMRNQRDADRLRALSA